jgi:hypothetical protein
MKNHLLLLPLQLLARPQLLHRKHHLRLPKATSMLSTRSSRSTKPDHHCRNFGSDQDMPKPTWNNDTSF